jgi:hypothetical protein
MPPVYIHSGINRPDLLALLAEEGASGMVNIRVIGEPRLQWAFRHYQEVPLFLDSGFRRKMDVRSYLAMIECYGHRFTWIANLDSPFDQQLSDSHYRLITSRLPCEELRSKILWIYQGGELADLKVRAKEHSLIGIGGCVPHMARHGIPATIRWLLDIGEVLEGVNARAHVFGVGNKKMLAFLGRQSWVASIDSSKWLVAYRAHIWLLPGGGCLQMLDRSRRECAVNNIRVIESWMRPAQHTQGAT